MNKEALTGIIIACVTAAIVLMVLVICPPGYTLSVSVSPSGAGSVSPPGDKYKSGCPVTLTASPASGYIFDRWSGDASGTSSSVTVTMDSDKSVTANFKVTTYTLITKINPLWGGFASPRKGLYKAGTEVTLTATPVALYRFDSWSGDISSTEPTITVTMNSDKTITANFVVAPQLTHATVVRVIDGDTIEVSISARWWLTYRVRYLGIDAPETGHYSQPAECFGTQASVKNSQLVAGKTVGLEKDVSETDQYGRLLRYVWVDDILVNDYLVRHGYARVYTYPPDVRYAEQFRQAEREARENNWGLWAAC